MFMSIDDNEVAALRLLGFRRPDPNAAVERPNNLDVAIVAEQRRTPVL
jgi:hypothetical protein